MFSNTPALSLPLQPQHHGVSAIPAREDCILSIVLGPTGKSGWNSSMGDGTRSAHNVVLFSRSQQAVWNACKQSPAQAPVTSTLAKTTVPGMHTFDGDACDDDGLCALGPHPTLCVQTCRSNGRAVPLRDAHGVPVDFFKCCKVCVYVHRCFEA